MTRTDRATPVTNGRVGRIAALRARHRRFARFVLAAGASVPVNICARIILSRSLDYGVAVLVAHGIGMVTAYILTRIFVFDRSGRTIHGELGRFASVNVLSAAMTWALSVSLVDYVFPATDFHTQPELIAHVIGLGFASVASFIGHSHFSFRRAR